MQQRVPPGQARRRLGQVGGELADGQHGDIPPDRVQTGDVIATKNPLTGCPRPQIMPSGPNEDTPEALRSLGRIGGLRADVLLPATATRGPAASPRRSPPPRPQTVPGPDRRRFSALSADLSFNVGLDQVRLGLL